MLSRAYTKPSKKASPKNPVPNGDEDGSCRSISILDYEDCIFSFMDIDVPFVFCNRICNEVNVTLREVLRASVGVIGESRVGMTEKVVMKKGKCYGVYAVKRFKKVIVKQKEFGKRVMLLAQVSLGCKYLVPLRAYLYTKRMKLLACDYYPMGSLDDLLSGARKLGHTSLDWNQRMTIICSITKAILFIHSLSPSHDNKFQMNVHGKIKSSNVMINTDFTACLSDYGFSQLADRLEVVDNGKHKSSLSPSSSSVHPQSFYLDTLSQTSDIYNFGVLLLDLLGGAKAMECRENIIEERKEKIEKGEWDFFEFVVEGKERRKALRVLDVALSCTISSHQTRPTIQEIIIKLDVFGA
ncbi:probable inactive receptor kinase At5g58300 [Impatiens glandulifera]|uniref:probable inactive receptor kinase At5g58300 n=1 Tax=Impatiens glandulifera TaxID=253017 RepID=UPI001FB08AF4|nr:probable inactive receptor kinase At5g58300 [Impatiens glandulifera]